MTDSTPNPQQAEEIQHVGRLVAHAASLVAEVSSPGGISFAILQELADNLAVEASFVTAARAVPLEQMIHTTQPLPDYWADAIATGRDTVPDTIPPEWL